MRCKVFLLSFLLCPLAWSGGASGPQKIETIEIRGTKRPLRLETAAGQVLDPARINHDVHRLWATGWFSDVRVEAGDAAGGKHVVFTVKEKQRLFLRKVLFDPSHWESPVKLLPGTTIDMVQARRMAAALERQLFSEGYTRAKVEPELIPAGFQQADVKLHVDEGPRCRMQEVRFSGELGLSQHDLQRALHRTRARFFHPGYSDNAVNEDLERLRSLYISRGYFDARLAADKPQFTGKRAAVKISIAAGPRYRVDRLELSGFRGLTRLAPGPGGEFPSRELCRCLLEARRQAEAEGRAGFAVRLEAEAVPGKAQPHVLLTARIDPGEPYSVARIEFRGNHVFSDSTLRKALVLDEGDLFDRERLRRSLARLNRLGLLEPLSERDVAFDYNREARTVNATIFIREKKRGRWWFSGPLGPPGIAGPLQAGIASRLPAWGRGALELSTYYGYFSPLMYTPALLKSLPWAAQPGRLVPWVALERPYLPGQGWLSGFRWSPGWDYRQVLGGYGLMHLQVAGRSALQVDNPLAVDLAVPFEWTGSGSEVGSHPLQAGTLLCESRRPRLYLPRLIGAGAVDFLLAPRIF
jgi:outer membrane protein assembly factor BamA